jgi:hypothetical protein
LNKNAGFQRFLFNDHQKTGHVPQAHINAPQTDTTQ